MGRETSMDRRSFVKGVAATSMGAAALSIMGCAPDKGNLASTAAEAEAPYPGLTDADDFANSAAEREPITTFADEKTYDIVVVGAGTSGIPAALTALEEGATVACLQKETKAISQGGSSTGIVLDASTELGLQQFKQAYREKCSWRLNHDLLDTWVNHSGETILWMCDRTTAAGYPPYVTASTELTFENDNSKVLRITNRFGPKPENNGNMIVVLADYAAQQGVEMFYETPGVQLVADESGAVTGVIGKGPDGYVKFNANKAVILATGDYQNNDSLVAKYSPDLVGFGRKQSNKTGDGILMSMMVGGHMVPANHSRQMHDIDSGPMTDEPFLAVDEDGNRFMNEGMLGVWGNFLQVMRQPKGIVFGVADANWKDYVQKNAPEHVYPGTGGFHDGGFLQSLEEELPQVMAAGAEGHKIRGCVTYGADTLEELAGYLGLEDEVRETFLAEVARYNELCAKGVDEDFGKDSFLMDPIATPPFYASCIDSSEFKLGLVELSGLVTDGNQQVLDGDDRPIPGLYATGNSCGGRFALQYCTPIAGISIGWATTMGKVVGETVAAL